MRIAVAGGTGLAGRHTVTALQKAGHDTLVLARSVGVDLTSGHGLAEALVGVDAVIDVTNTPASSPEQARAFFFTTTTTTTTGQLLAAEHHAGVGHHVVLSIVGVDRVKGNAHYAGKRAQEQVALAGPVPATILRATQFFDYAAMVLRWTRHGQVATVPPLLVQPVAVTDVADVLVQVAAGPPQHGVRELAGPQPQDLVDMVRRLLAVRGESLRLLPGWGGRCGVELAGEVLLPGPDAQLAPATYETWLAAHAQPADTADPPPTPPARRNPGSGASH